MSQYSHESSSSTEPSASRISDDNRATTESTSGVVPLSISAQQQQQQQQQQSSVDDGILPISSLMSTTLLLSPSDCTVPYRRHSMEVSSSGSFLVPDTPSFLRSPSPGVTEQQNQQPQQQQQQRSPKQKKKKSKNKKDSSKKKKKSGSSGRKSNKQQHRSSSLPNMSTTHWAPISDEGGRGDDNNNNKNKKRELVTTSSSWEGGEGGPDLLLGTTNSSPLEVQEDTTLTNTALTAATAASTTTPFVIDAPTDTKFEVSAAAAPPPPPELPPPTPSEVYDGTTLTADEMLFEGFAEGSFDAFVEPHLLLDPPPLQHQQQDEQQQQKEDNEFQQQQQQQRHPSFFLEQDVVVDSPSVTEQQEPPASGKSTHTAGPTATASATTARTTETSVTSLTSSHPITATTTIVAHAAQAPPDLVVEEQQQPQATATTTTTEEVGEFVKEHGERFQDYLKASGQMDEQLAAATAAQFQAFLASHVPSGNMAAGNNTTSDSPAAAAAAASGGIMAGREIVGTSFEDDVSELGNSVLGSDWDNGTFVSYSTKQQEQQQQKKLSELQMMTTTTTSDGGTSSGGVQNVVNHSGGDEFGDIKRNETFVRRRASLNNTIPTTTTTTTTTTEAGPSSGAAAGLFELPPAHPMQQRHRSQLTGGDHPHSTQSDVPMPLPQTPQQRPLGDYGAFIGETNYNADSSSGASISTHRTTSTIGLARTFREQWIALSKEERDCVTALKRKWERWNPKQKYADKWYLQFARCSPGKPFTLKTALKVMKTTKRHFLDLCDDGMTEKMERYMYTKLMFPCAGLKTRDGLDVNYVRPSRYFPSERPVLFVKEMAIYIMNHRLEKEENCLNGFCVLMNMKGWTMRNFSVAYSNTMSLMTQGYTFPTRIATLLVVDSPAWFGYIWSMTKLMLAPSFRRRVKFIKTSNLPNYLAPGFERFLPDDIYGGQANTDEVIQNFIAERKRIDAERGSNQNQAVSANRSYERRRSQP